jgi:transposase
MMAIRALLIGIPREQVAKLHDVTDRTLLNWICWFNERGVDGLISEKSPGAPSIITPEQSEEFKDLIEHPDKGDQTHWTGRKFHGYLQEKHKLEISYRSIIRWLHKQNYTLKVPRPWADLQDEKARQEYLNHLMILLEAPEIDVWYQDETGVEADPRPRRRWAKKGTPLKVPQNGGHIRMNAAGVVCPRTGVFYALEFTHMDRDVFQVFLDNANEDIHLERPKNMIICDNATWHKVKSLNWGNFTPLFLPPYSPDLNPIERLWKLMKAEWFTDFIAKTRENLIERLDKALCWLADRQISNRITCSNPKI